MKVSVIIPSLNPDEKLICVVDSLREAGFDDIILVNDGSDENHREPFEHASAYPECTILTHEIKVKDVVLKLHLNTALKTDPI